MQQALAPMPECGRIPHVAPNLEAERSSPPRAYGIPPQLRQLLRRCSSRPVLVTHPSVSDGPPRSDRTYPIGPTASHLHTPLPTRFAVRPDFYSLQPGKGTF